MSLETVSDTEQRRKSFAGWLLRAWEWAVDNGRVELTIQLKTLIDQASDEGFPLWERARQYGIIGDTALADRLRNILGLPLQTQERTGWEREISFSPVIALEPEVFQKIYAALGWANRQTDPKYPGANFWLWSDATNMVRFVKREPMKVEESDE